MLSAVGGVRPGPSQENRLLTPEYEISWQGLVYLEGVAAGAPSLARFAQVAETQIASASRDLHGVFFVTMRHRKSGHSHSFVDNSGLFQAFHSERFVRTSFLELAALENLHPSDLCPQALVEFFHFGCIYSDRTLLNGISLLAPEIIAVTTPAGDVQLLPKPLPDIAEPLDATLESLLEHFAASTRHERVSLDLTGGVDSRLLAVALAYFGLPFELAASGLPDSNDLLIAAEVARALGRDFHPCHHDPADTDWRTLFALCDGSFDLAKAHRPAQLQRDRARRGITLAVSGAGGELFKDFWWMQDFPFYRRRKPNLARLYSTRIAPTPLRRGCFAEPYRTLSARFREHQLEALSTFVGPGNTQTYDRIYYQVRARAMAGRFLTNSLHILPHVAAPYLDRTAARIGFALPRSLRFFNRYHRALITRFSPPAARIRTTEGGMSASSETVVNDLRKFIADRFIRMMKKIAQRTTGRTYFQERTDHPQLRPNLRDALENRRSIERLIEHGILHPSLQLADVNPARWGVLLNLDFLLEALEDARIARAAESVPAVTTAENLELDHAELEQLLRRVAGIRPPPDHGSNQITDPR